jgi:hypothetical protein
MTVPLAGLVLSAESRVYAGVPGTWQYTRAFMLPDRYGWKIVTAADPMCHLFDGEAVRCFIGTDEVSCDPSPQAPLRTHALWTAAVNLDALRGANVAVAPLAASELPRRPRGALGCLPGRQQVRPGLR